MQVTNYVIERLQLDVPAASSDGGASDMHAGTTSSSERDDTGQHTTAPTKMTKVEILCNDQVRQGHIRVLICAAPEGKGTIFLLL
jgi:hypothetical protein